MPMLVPSAGCIRAICGCLEAGITSSSGMIEHTGYSKRSVWTTLQWLQANGYTQIEQQRARGRLYTHRLVRMPEPALLQDGPDAIALAVQSRWDAQALWSALWWPPLPAGRLRTVIRGEPI